MKNVVFSIFGLFALTCDSGTLLAQESTNCRTRAECTVAVVSYAIELPKLPIGWGLPKESDLSHVLRPKWLDPVFVVALSLDDDGPIDFAVIAIRDDRSEFALLVYPTSVGAWRVYERENYRPYVGKGLPMGVGQDFYVKKNVVLNCLEYFELGGHGKKYCWNNSKKDFDIFLDSNASD